MKETQLDWVKARLREGGVSRNQALRNYISRLGARILDCKREGWEIDGKWVKTDLGKDYVYEIKKGDYPLTTGK